MPVQGLRTTLSATFQTIREWARLSQGGRIKRQKKSCEVDPKISWKFCSITRLHFLSSNPSILQTIPTEIKASKCQAKGKKMGQDRLKRKGEEKAKSKSPEGCVTLKLKTLRNFCFYVCLNFWSLQFASRTKDREVLDLWTAFWEF